jgi:hypothetical protein
MIHSDGDPLHLVPTKMAPESFPLRERLRLPMQSVLNSRPPKQTVSPRDKPLWVRRSPSVATTRVDK